MNLLFCTIEVQTENIHCIIPEFWTWERKDAGRNPEGKPRKRGRLNVRTKVCLVFMWQSSEVIQNNG